MGNCNCKRGLRGYSAYEIAVANGFEGTEQEWVDSLEDRNFAEDDLTFTDTRLHDVAGFSLNITNFDVINYYSEVSNSQFSVTVNGDINLNPGGDFKVEGAGNIDLINTDGYFQVQVTGDAGVTTSDGQISLNSPNGDFSVESGGNIDINATSDINIISSSGTINFTGNISFNAGFSPLTAETGLLANAVIRIAEIEQILIDMAIIS
jgi:hypothetical protein